MSKRGYLTIPQVEAVAIEAAMQRTEYGTVIGFLAYTGLRWGEMAALRVESFDMLRRRINVSEAVAEVRGKLVWGSPKDHERRSVPFPTFLAEPLAGLMAGKGRSELVFTGPKGAVLAVSRFRPRVFAPAVRRARRRWMRLSRRSRRTTCDIRLLHLQKCAELRLMHHSACSVIGTP
jgi:integrase